MNLSVIVPLYNEEANIAELYQRLTDSVKPLIESYELIFINDGSKDQTAQKIAELAQTDSCVRFIHLTRNFGHQIAVTAGLDLCQGEAAVIIDGDLQDPPELIKELYSEYKKGFDVVYAKRNKRKGESWFKLVTAHIYYRLLKLMTTIDIPMDVGDFRIIDKKVIHYLRNMPESNKFLRGQIAWLGFSNKMVEYDRDERKQGASGYSFQKMLKFGLDGITSFSDKPIRLVTRLGFIFSGFSFIVILYAIFSHFVLNRTITGWTSLIISSMFIGGVQLISVGIIGAYIGRINRNVLNRPLYIIGDSNIEN